MERDDRGVDTLWASPEQMNQRSWRGLVPEENVESGGRGSSVKVLVMLDAYREVELGSDEDLVEVALHAEFAALLFHALGSLTDPSFAAEGC